MSITGIAEEKKKRTIEREIEREREKQREVQDEVMECLTLVSKSLALYFWTFDACECLCFVCILFHTPCQVVIMLCMLCMI